MVKTHMAVRGQVGSSLNSPEFKKYSKKAFSLAEALVALLIGSLILGMSAPLITKQLKHNSFTDVQAQLLNRKVENVKDVAAENRSNINLNRTDIGTNKTDILNLRARLQNIENKGFDTKFDEINNSIKNLQSDYNSIQTQEQKDYSQDIATLKTGVEKNTKKIENLLPIGSIIMWSGTTIPTNWALCNGANGTPDLRDRFVVGAGSSYSIGASGGVNTVTLTKDQMPEHKHLMWFNGNSANNPWGHAVNTYQTPSDRGVLSTDMSLNYNSPVGKNEPHENRPPYYALAYIMKIK